MSLGCTPSIDSRSYIPCRFEPGIVNLFPECSPAPFYDNLWGSLLEFDLPGFAWIRLDSAKSAVWRGNSIVGNAPEICIGPR